MFIVVCIRVSHLKPTFPRHSLAKFPSGMSVNQASTTHMCSTERGSFDNSTISYLGPPQNTGNTYSSGLRVGLFSCNHLSGVKLSASCHKFTSRPIAEFAMDTLWPASTRIPDGRISSWRATRPSIATGGYMRSVSLNTAPQYRSSRSWSQPTAFPRPTTESSSASILVSTSGFVGSSLKRFVNVQLVVSRPNLTCQFACCAQFIVYWHIYYAPAIMKFKIASTK